MSSLSNTNDWGAAYPFFYGDRLCAVLTIHYPITKLEIEAFEQWLELQKEALKLCHPPEDLIPKGALNIAIRNMVEDKK